MTQESAPRLVWCHVCSQRVSTHASSCPHCGHPGPFAFSPPPEVGTVHNGHVSSIESFGAFVDIPGGHMGLVHISELADFRVRRVEDVVKIGESVRVKVIGLDAATGKIRLSRRQA